MILKLLLIIAVITTVYILFFKKSTPTVKNKKKKENKTSDMVECATCGVYCEIDESIISNGKYYCSQKCLVDAQ